jgi:hypothetical protein
MPPRGQTCGLEEEQLERIVSPADATVWKNPSPIAATNRGAVLNNRGGLGAW